MNRWKLRKIFCNVTILVIIVPWLIGPLKTEQKDLFMMHIITEKSAREASGIREKFEVLREIEPDVESLMEAHKQKRRLWMPNDFLPADEEMNDEEYRLMDGLRDRARSVTDPVRVAIALNLLTEEGLPHFHRILATTLGTDNIWNRWNFLWTAEEDRHGNVLRDYVRDARLFNFAEVESMQFEYQQAGFTPGWDRDPFKVFVYTSLQERATQISHSNTGKAVGDDELVLKSILKQVASDEARHYSFYRQIFKRILDVDPNRALQSALDILPSIDMPGISMPAFNRMADIVRRIGIYGPEDYHNIVRETIDFWKIDKLTGLSKEGRKAQDKIMQIPQRLEKVAKYIKGKTGEKSFSFDFLYQRNIVMDSL